jgi:DNA-binding winged helix-turn-helix (wHTH) protein/tetratricopeptide (TPR) repeat protein
MDSVAGTSEPSVLIVALASDASISYSLPTSCLRACIGREARAVMRMELNQELISRDMVYTPRRHRVRFGRFELDAANVDLRKDGRRVRLRPQALTLLALLVDRAGQLVTREELRATLWADDTFVDFDHSLNVAVGEVRRALSDSAADAWAIETVPRHGYRFVAPVEPLDPQGLRRRASDHAVASVGPAPSFEPDAPRAAAATSPVVALASPPVGGEIAATPVSPADSPVAVRSWWHWGGVLAAAVMVALAVQLVRPRSQGGGAAIAVPGPAARQGGTENAEAWRAYARARVHWSRRNDCTRAIDDYRTAAAADPQFVLAWVGIADCYTIRGDREESQLAIAEAARRAPDLGEVHASRGLWRMFMAWDWKGARDSLEEAVRLAPDYASAHQWLGLLELFQGNVQGARAALARAAALDPASPTIATDQALAELQAGRPGAALAQCRHAERLAADHVFTVSCFVAVYSRLGRPRDLHATLFGERPATDAAATRLIDDYRRRELERLRAQTPVVDYVLAQRLSALGRHDEALDSLERAVLEHEFLVPFAVLEPDFDALRGAPRFRAVLDRTGLPQRELAP